VGERAPSAGAEAIAFGQNKIKGTAATESAQNFTKQALLLFLQ